MGYSDGLITETNVSIKDVKDVLEASSYDLGTLCTYSKINKWSKNKPIRGEGASINRTANPEYYRCMKDGYNCGLTYNKYITVNSMISDWSNNWTYRPPLSTDCKRLGDFRLYNKKISGFLNEVKVFGGVKSTDGSWFQCPSAWILMQTDGTYRALLADFSINGVRTENLDSTYFALVLVRSNGDKYLQTHTTSFKDTPTQGSSDYGNYQRFMFVDSSVPVGDYTVYPCLSVGKQTKVLTALSGNDINVGTYKLIPLPISQMSMKVSSLANMYVVILAFTLVSSTGSGTTKQNKVNVSISIKNNTPHDWVWDNASLLKLTITGMTSTYQSTTLVNGVSTFKGNAKANSTTKIGDYETTISAYSGNSPYQYYSASVELKSPTGVQMSTGAATLNL